MRSYIKSGLILIAIILVFSACNSQLGNQSILTEGDFNEIGDGHNRVLSQAYEQIVQKAENGELPGNRQDMKMMVNQVVDACVANDHQSYACSYQNDMLMDIMDMAIADPQILSKASQEDMLLDILSDSVVTIEKNRSIFDSLYVILNSTNSQTEKEYKIDRLYDLVNESSDPEEEKAPMLAALRTAKKSDAYWQENIDEWDSLLGESLDKSTAVGFLGAVGIIDAVGAVVGVIEGIRDTNVGDENRGWTIIGRGIGEAGKASLYAVIVVVAPILL